MRTEELKGIYPEFTEYLLEGERSENTIDNYLRAVRQFYEHFNEVTKANMISYKKMCIENYAPKTAAARCIAMNQYCKFLGLDKYTVKSIKIPKYTVAENVISEEEFKRYTDWLKENNEKIYWMVQFVARTGVRVSELIKIKRSCLETGEEVMWTKGKIRRIIIPEKFIEESREYFKRQQGEYLFMTAQKKPYSTRGIAEVIKRTGIKAGIRKEVLYPHSFRHFYAKQFLKSNSNIALLADLMGHQDINTTAIYLKMSKAEQRKALDETMRW